MKKQKRIPVKGGSARVDKNCSKETIEYVNRLAEFAYNKWLAIKTQQRLNKPDHE